MWAATRGRLLHSCASAAKRVRRGEISGPIRHLSSKNEPNEEDIELMCKAINLLSDPENKLVRDVYYSKTGEEIFSIQPGDELRPDFDWAQFERAFGVDSASDEEEEDEGWEQLKKKYSVSTEYIEEENGEHRTKVVNDETGEESIIVPLETEENGQERRHGLHHLLEEKAEPKVQLRDVAEFKAPRNKKRPGYERKAMMKEREIEKAVTELVCNKFCEWYQMGGEIERIVLSPNQIDVTVFYKIEHDGSHQAQQWWQQWPSAKPRFRNEIRNAIAQRLRSKYVPKVHLHHVDHHQPTPQPSAIHTLLEQIAAEHPTTPPPHTLNPEYDAAIPKE